MDPAAPPPWRVFDAPGPEASPATPEPATPAGGARQAGTGTAWFGARPTSPALLAAGAVLAVGGFALAAVLALGGLGGNVAVGGGLDLGSPTASAGINRGDLVVDVAGAVLRPGVYRLPPGARIGDAIAAAGGYSPRVAAEAASAKLNLAAVLHDGDQVVVPSRDDLGAGQPSAPGSGNGGGGGAHLIDLNHASADELDTLPGIGHVTAAKIIAARTESPFTTVDQLLERKLVGQKVFDELKSLVTV